MPSSSQIRNALAYMAVTVLVLVFLNIYSASASRDLMFKAKCSSAQDKLKVVTSSFSGVDALTQETAGQIISSQLIDQFGFFGMPVQKFNAKQIPGYVLLAAGVALVVTG